MSWTDWLQSAILISVLTGLTVLLLWLDSKRAGLRKRLAQGAEGTGRRGSAARRLASMVLGAYWDNKLLTFLLLVPFGLSYGWFMASTGLPRYFWSDSIVEQGIAGAAVAAMILCIVYTMVATDEELR